MKGSDPFMGGSWRRGARNALSGPIGGMARRPRCEEAGAVHHVFARHNEQRLLFRDDVDRRRYLAGLALVVGRFSWQCMAYCLMPNHLHLLVATPMANLGRGMQRLHGDYGRWFAD